MDVIIRESITEAAATALLSATSGPGNALGPRCPQMKGSRGTDSTIINSNNRFVLTNPAKQALETFG